MLWGARTFRQPAPAGRFSPAAVSPAVSERFCTPAALSRRFPLLAPAGRPRGPRGSISLDERRASGTKEMTHLPCPHSTDMPHLFGAAIADHGQPGSRNDANNKDGCGGTKEMIATALSTRPACHLLGAAILDHRPAHRGTKEMMQAPVHSTPNVFGISRGTKELIQPSPMLPRMAISLVAHRYTKEMSNPALSTHIAISLVPLRAPASAKAEAAAAEPAAADDLASAAACSSAATSRWKGDEDTRLRRQTHTHTMTGRSGSSRKGGDRTSERREVAADDRFTEKTAAHGSSRKGGGCLIDRFTHLRLLGRPLGRLGRRRRRLPHREGKGAASERRRKALFQRKLAFLAILPERAVFWRRKALIQRKPAFPVALFPVSGEKGTREQQPALSPRGARTFWEDSRRAGWLLVVRSRFTPPSVHRLSPTAAAACEVISRAMHEELR